MEYNKDIGECLSDDPLPDAICPDGSQGIIRQGPNGIKLIECPLPNPDTNPEPQPKPSLNQGEIGNKVGVLKEEILFFETESIFLINSAYCISKYKIGNIGLITYEQKILKKFLIFK